MTGEPAYRVVQWATGNIGSRSLRAVIEHPRLSLVGLWVSNPEKAGRDAGSLCGLGTTGITATGDLDEILALRPDCVLYMQQGSDIDVLCALLESGANVVTTAGGFHHPGSMDPTVRRRVESACERGGSSIHSTGSSPGFISEAVPIVLTSIQRRLDRLRIAEFADLSSRNSPNLLFDLMGFGRSPSTFDVGRWAHGAIAFGPSLRLVGDALGLPLDSIESGGEVAVAAQDTEIAAGTITCRDGGGSADDGDRAPERQRADRLQCHLVLLDRARRGVGPAGGRVEGDRRGGLPTRHRHPTGDPPRADG